MFKKTLDPTNEQILLWLLGDTPNVCYRPFNEPTTPQNWGGTYKNLRAVWLSFDSLTKVVSMLHIKGPLYIYIMGRWLVLCCFCSPKCQGSCWDDDHRSQQRFCQIKFELSGQIIIFHQPRFPWNKGSHFPYNHHHLGEIGRMGDPQWNLTRTMYFLAHMTCFNI